MCSANNYCVMTVPQLLYRNLRWAVHGLRLDQLPHRSAANAALHRLHLNGLVLISAHQTELSSLEPHLFPSLLIKCQYIISKCFC
jgi:hypothetical protein